MEWMAGFVKNVFGKQKWKNDMPIGSKREGLNKFKISKLPGHSGNDYSKKVNRKKANQQSVGRVKPIVRQF